MTRNEPAGAGTGPEADRATWREYCALAVLTLPMLVQASDLSVLFVAMPSVSADLQPGPSQTLWILHIYGFLIAGLLITMGRLGDRIGRRRLLLIGSGAFAAFAVVAAWSTTAEMLIVARALLGVAGASLMPSTYSLLRVMFRDAAQRRFAIAIMLNAFAIGSAAGPLLGGALLQYFWWGSVFLINVPPLVLVLITGPLLLPEYRNPQIHRLDPASIVLSVGGLLAVIYGLQEAAEHGIAPVHGASIAAGSLLAWMFVRRQRSLPDPLLNLGLFANRAFSASLAMVLLTAIGVLGGYFLFTQYLQWVHGLTPLVAGLWTVPYLLGIGVGGLLAPSLVRWFRHANIAGAGLVLAATGLGFVVVTGTASLPAIATSMCAAGVGQGAAMALGSDFIISTAPEQHTGSAAAMQEISGELGSAMGIAAGGSVGTLVYQRTLTQTMPSKIPPSEAEVALESVPAAERVAEQLGTPLGGELLHTTHNAYSQSLYAVFGVGAVIVLAVAIAVLVLLRDTAAPQSG